MSGELNSSSSAQALWRLLPITFTAHYWGDEIYGSILLEHEDENPVEVIEEPGTLAFWPLGNAFCLFWGPTPVSRSGEIRPASPVNIIGKITSGLEAFIDEKPEKVKVRVERG